LIAANGTLLRREKKELFTQGTEKRIEQILMDNYSQKLTMMSNNRNAYRNLRVFCLFIYSIPGKYLFK
jgi:hypothetical protein